MRTTLLALALSCSGFVAAGCAPALREAPQGALDLPGAAQGGGPLDASFRATETSCRAEEARLADAARSRASTRQVAEVILALSAGAFATGAAIYAGLDPTPKGYVVVPLSVGAAGAAVPLGVLLTTDHGSPAVAERESRIRDRRLAVRDAYQRLSEARRDRERAEASLAEIERRVSEHRTGDQQVDAGRAAIVGERRAEVNYEKQRERDAETALAEALLRLGEVCGREAEAR